MSDTASFDLSNWLTPPQNRESFWSVRDVLPVAAIANDPRAVRPMEVAPIDPAELVFADQSGVSWTLDRFLQVSCSDALLILHDGRIAFEWYAPERTRLDEHIVFSVTKSIVGSLAGVLVAQGQLDPHGLAVDYVPEMGSSGFARARVRDLLDMTVSLDFVEAYLSADSPFARYREATGWHEFKGSGKAPGLHTFLGTLKAKADPHGTRFDYLSPVSDLLGWVCERAGGRSLPALLSDLLWKPLRTEAPAWITVDCEGAPRAAGGFGCRVRDLARFGECMRMDGRIGGQQVIPSDWVSDIRTRGDRQAWQRGSMVEWIPEGCYRNQWWITNDRHGSFFAAGIYGQWLFVSPGLGTVIVKLASPPTGPADRARFSFELMALHQLAKCVSGTPRSGGK